MTRAPAFAIVLLLLSGCSATQWLYNSMDWLAYTRIDDRFAITDAQQSRVEELIAGAHRWHRRTQLPAYANTLEQMAERYADGLSRADVNWIADRIEMHRRAAVEELVPRAAPFLADLDSTQVAHFRRRGLERIEEAAEPLSLDPEKRLNERVDSVEEQLERWLGDLSSGQLDFLRTRLADLPDFRARWIAHRRVRLEEMTQLLATAPDAAAIEAGLLHWWVDLDVGYTPDYARARADAWQRFFTLMVEFDSLVTTTQRSQAVETLRRYAAEFRGLSRDD
ncbi:MAG: DUF6279 family lipoprotein [Gammaproteobacteria bacterium]